MMEQPPAQHVVAADPPAEPATPPPSAEAALPTEPALPLDYANAWPELVAPSSEAIRLFWWAVRRIILAGGFGLIAWGLTTIAEGKSPRAGPFALAWGVFFLVLMLPMRWRLHRRKRRRRRPDVAPARRSGI